MSRFLLLTTALLAVGLMSGCDDPPPMTAPADSNAPSLRAERFGFVLDTGPGALVIHITIQDTLDLVSGGQARRLATARLTVLTDNTLLVDEERVTLKRL